MSRTGWIKLHRQIMDSEFYKEPRRFSRSEAWIDILLRANHEEEDGIEAGSFLTSYNELAKSWGWSKSTTWNFLKYLSAQNMIVLGLNDFGTDNRTDSRTVIAIVKWEFYQGRKNGKKNDKLNEVGTKNEFLPITEKEDKNIYSELLSFWNQQKITVHRKLTEDMIKAIDATLKVHTKEEIMQAIARYAKIYHDKDYFFSYNWTLINFLKQKNALPDFLDDGQKWLSYKNATATKETEKPKTDLDVYEYSPSWREGELPL